MVRTLLLPGHAEARHWIDVLKHGFEMLVGPLGPQPLSSHIYGLYTGLVYLTPLFGGPLADCISASTAPSFWGRG
jgi:POT family proton-dependent oligopeptide transporter